MSNLLIWEAQTAEYLEAVQEVFERIRQFVSDGSLVLAEYNYDPDLIEGIKGLIEVWQISQEIEIDERLQTEKLSKKYAAIERQLLQHLLEVVSLSLDHKIFDDSDTWTGYEKL